MHTGTTNVSLPRESKLNQYPKGTLENTKQVVHDTMKAVICTRYGSPKHLMLQKQAIPMPAADEILVKVHAASVTAADSMMRQGKPLISRLFLGFRRPSATPGTGFAGVVSTVGSDVTQFTSGDRVFGETGVKFAAHAEYVCLKADALLLNTPTTLSDDEAACICDGPLTSYNFLVELGKIKAGNRVLIIGASGSLGTAAVQLAKHFGAEVTAVCSAKNDKLVRSLGAHDVIDYTKNDYSQPSKGYDIIYDSVGKSTFKKSKQALAKDGRYLSPILDISLLISMFLSKYFGTKKAIFSATGMKDINALNSMLAQLMPLYSSRKIITVMDRHYRIEEIVDANNYVDTGRKVGNVVVKMHS